LKPADGINLTPGGAVRVDPETFATSGLGIFAGGDVAFGPRNLIEAVANGKRRPDRSTLTSHATRRRSR
jgi:formate dehydrogenase beta subunit